MSFFREIILLLILYLIYGTLSAVPLTDTSDIRNAVKIAEDSLSVNPVLSAQKAKTAYQNSKAIDYKYGLAASLSALGAAERRMDRLADAKIHLTEALRLCKEQQFKDLQLKVTKNLGNACFSENDFSSALRYYRQCLESSIQQKDSINMADAYHNIGVVLMNTDVKEAILYLEKCISVASPIHYTKRMAISLSSISSCYSMLNDNRQSMQYALKAYHLMDSLQMQIKSPDIYINMAIGYDDNNENDKAILFYGKAIELAGQNEDFNMQASALHNLGNLYDKLNEHAKTEQCYKDALAILEGSSNYEFISKINQSLADLYARTHRFEQAYRCMSKAFATNDSFLNEQKIEDIEKWNTKFRTQELSLKNTILNKELAEHKIIIFRNLLTTLIIIAFMVIAAVIFYSRYKEQQYETNLKVATVEQQQYRTQMNPHFIFNCMNSIQHYILHNDVMAANTYLSEFASLMRKTLDINAGQTISIKNEISYLDNYLLLEKMRFENKFEYEISCDENIDQNNTEFIPMIIQPFVENAILHGLCKLPDSSGKLLVQFRKESNRILCSVEDNGIGINASKQSKKSAGITHKSLGMELIEKRKQLMQVLKKNVFAVDITDKAEKDGNTHGTLVRITFHIDEKYD